MAATGYPLPVTEMLSLLAGVAYASRVSVADPGHVGKAKAAIRRAFEVQLEGKGFSIVEVLSTCPVGWGMTPSEAMRHLATDVMDAYATGTFVDRAKGIAPALPLPARVGPAPGGCAAAAPQRPLAKLAGRWVEE